MPTKQTEVSDGIIFDGALSANSTILLGVVLMATAAWLLWHDRHALGIGSACLFFALRTAVIGAALWMLAGPMQETVLRSTTTQSIAILADTSQSMETIDVVEPENALRWQLASTNDGNSSLVARADRARVAVTIANNACRTALGTLVEHRPLGNTKRAINELKLALDRVRLHCRQLGSELPSRRDDLAQQVERIETLLNDSIDPAVQSVDDHLSQQIPSDSSNWIFDLENLDEQIQSLSRRIEHLAGDLSQESAHRLVDAMEEFSRREQAMKTLDLLEKHELAELASHVRIRRFQFDEHLQPVAAQSTWAKVASLHARDEDLPEDAAKFLPMTNLAAVLEQIATTRAAESIRLAVLLSDGHHNDLDARPPQEVAAQLADLPVFVVPVGSSRAVRDIRLHRVVGPKKLIQHDSGQLEALVTALDCDAMAADVVLRYEGEEIDRQTIRFHGERVDRRIAFQVSAEELGWHEYELMVEPQLDEVSVANNVALVSLEVVRDRLRVLFADGMSRWEHRYLHQIFRRDAHIDCDELLFHPRLRGTGRLAANPRLPKQVDDWAEYDVVILGDIHGRQFDATSQAALAEYVRERQGNLLLIAGRDYMPQQYEGKPLVELLPVESDPSLVRAEAHSLVLTDEGRLHSALAITDSLRQSEQTWLSVSQKKQIHGISTYSHPKPTARTLIRAVPTIEAQMIENQPDYENLPAFLCWHQVGGGKVVYLAAPETWKLRYRVGDRLHHRFWGQMLRWMTATHLGSGTELVRMSTDQTRYDKNKPIEITVWLRDNTGRPLADQEVTIDAISLDESVASITLKSDTQVAGRYFGILQGLAPGGYEIVVGGDAVNSLLKDGETKVVRSVIAVDENDNVELLDTRCNRALLEQIAYATGGQVVPPTAIGEVLRLASLSPEVNDSIRRTPLWNRWTNLWIIFGCLSVEWIVRKQKGLV